MSHRPPVDVLHGSIRGWLLRVAHNLMLAARLVRPAGHVMVAAARQRVEESGQLGAVTG